MQAQVYTRVVLLNHLVSRSSTQAGQEHHPPTHSAEELLSILENRRKQGICVEYIGAADDENEETRARNGSNYDLVRLKDFKLLVGRKFDYAVLLCEYADQKVKSLSVIHTRNFTGREIAGDAEEAGASTAHVVIRLPKTGSYDDGNYRCALEYIQSGVSRKLIAALMRRQLRRHARAEKWTFDVIVTGKTGKREKKSYRYSPKLDLLADVGRTLNVAAGGSRELSHMVFTKRSEKRAIGQETSVIHTEYNADVEVKVSVSQGPSDNAGKRSWAQRIRDDFRERGYTSALYYRSAGGAAIGGKMHEEVEGAADLLLCPKELISLDSPPQRWREAFDDDVIDKLRELVDRDGLWQRIG